MGDPRDQEVSPKTRAARQRAREAQQQRLEKALEEVQKLGQQKPSSGNKAHKVSIGDPEARFMKQSDGGLAPSYNVQISADATQGIIVGVEVTPEASDSAQLLPALERIERRLKQRPQQIVADAAAGAAEQRAGSDLSPLRGKSRRLSVLPAETGVLSR
jgi:hypothetical protein